jgi:hypothetical protein
LSTGGAHYGTYATTARDGHGRATSSIERVRVNGQLELHTTTTQLSPLGAPEVVTRAASNGQPAVQRWMQYDSWGRLVLNVEPNSTVNYGPPGTDPATMKAWRYAYDDLGNLVGTSDPRGCGYNAYFDASGRPFAVDHSPCLASQSAYTAPDLASGDGTESFTQYDSGDSALASTGLAAIGTYAGRVASVSDVAAKVVLTYDGAGHVSGTAKRVAAPGSPSVALGSRYAAGPGGAHWWTTTTTYDAMGRPSAATTGAETLLGASVTGGNASTITTTYGVRGFPVAIGGSYGTLIKRSVIDANGKTTTLAYGDNAGTTTTLGYDAKLRLVTALTNRGPTAAWATPPPANASGTTQATLFASTTTYDGADNPLTVIDNRDPNEWAAGAKPVSRTMTYDDA